MDQAFDLELLETLALYSRYHRLTIHLASMPPETQCPHLAFRSFQEISLNVEM